MRKSEKIEARLQKLGFRLKTDIRVVKGPKVISDILECWHVTTFDKDGKQMLIASEYTMTHLLKTGFKLVPPNRGTSIYGDLLAVPTDYVENE